MAEKIYDVVGIGNAIVDIIARCDEGFLSKHDLAKGFMRLIDAAEANRLYEAMGPAIERSGGSVANSIAGLASFGAKCGFIGRVAADQFGGIFRHDIRSLGVDYDTLPASDGAPTARCLILVTPDGERTMNTFLGAAQNLYPADVDAGMIAASAFTYLEGYLWDPPHAKEAFRKAATIAHEAGRKVALTLSDAFCVSRYRAEFVELIKTGTVDLVFANESELKSLYETADVDTAVVALRDDARLAVVTRSEKGCVVVGKDGTIEVPAAPIDTLVDATGAGDLFAAGFLFGLARGRDHKTAAQLGAMAAAEVIQHIGARPEVSLKELARQNGLPL